MKNNQFMEEVSVEEIIDRYNLIVPEIQREYVWGNNEHQILKLFIEDIQNGYEQNAKNEELVDIQERISNVNSKYKSSIDDLINKLHSKEREINIGFLYSYRPDYYIFKDANEDVYLIDGQQRFTTLFLFLFYFAIKEGKRDEFIHLFRFNEEKGSIAFDYRVRTLTHQFLIDLIRNVKNEEDLLNIRYKTWFLKSYDNDPTVKAIVGNDNDKNQGLFPILHQYFHDKTKDKNYYDYIKSSVKFWHFKTEETSQGEELYITMNSRGQGLASNESIRAQLFKNLENQTDLSKKWEEWQDFFWKNRNKEDEDASADNGFNEFLRWVQIIEMTINRRMRTDKDDDEKDIINLLKWENEQELDIKYLKKPIKKIESYFETIKYLFNENIANNIKSNYNNFEEIDIDLLKKEWLHPTTVISQIDCFRLLPIINYCKRVQKENSPDPKNIFRLIRFFYTISKNKDVSRNAGTQCLYGIKMAESIDINGEVTNFLNYNSYSTILNEHTREKLKLFRDNPDNREKYEELIWRAEDIKINNGNISHLIKTAKELQDNTGKPFLEVFEKLIDIYDEIMSDPLQIMGDLLTISVFRQINDRIKIKKNWHQNDEFMNLLKNYYSYTGSLNDFLKNKRKNFLKTYSSEFELSQETDPKKQLWIYYILNRELNVDVNWHWSNSKSFGIYDKEQNNQNTLFSNLFQSYNKNWVNNADKYIKLNNSSENKISYFNSLLQWANS